MSQFERFEVVGELPIVDSRTGKDTTKGQVVELDPARVNIPALVESGHVRPTTGKKAGGSS